MAQRIRREWQCILQAIHVSRSTSRAVRGEAVLWRAVIMQAVVDAANRSLNPEASYQRHEAVAWLTGRSRDFVMVCDLAGLDPGYVRRMAQKALRGGCRWRVDPGCGKRRRKTCKAPTDSMADDA